MVLSDVFERFVKGSPVGVMARALMERALEPSVLDGLFRKEANKQYEKELLFSSLVNLMALVVCGIREALGTASTWLPGYRIKVLDGNHIASTERRLEVLRDCAAGPLPGQSLVVLEPETGLATQMVGCEDGHAQERSLLEPVLAAVEPKDLYIADRNFCTLRFLLGIAKRDGFFVFRHHANMPVTSSGTLRHRGRTESGEVLNVRAVNARIFTSRCSSSVTLGSAVFFVGVKSTGDTRSAEYFSSARSIRLRLRATGGRSLVRIEVALGPLSRRLQFTAMRARLQGSKEP
jgi:hypothetical protein